MSFLTPNKLLWYNKGSVLIGNNIECSVRLLKVAKLDKLDKNKISLWAFVTQRARRIYITSICRLNPTFIFALTSLVTQSVREATKALNKAVKIAKA